MIQYITRAAGKFARYCLFIAIYEIIYNNIVYKKIV